MPSRTDNSVDRVRRYRDKALKEGAAFVSFTLLPSKDGEALKAWRRLVFDHRGPKAALLHLLRVAAGNAELSDDELISTLSARLKARRMGENASDDAVRQKAEKAGKSR